MSLKNKGADNIFFFFLNVKVDVLIRDSNEAQSVHGSNVYK